MPSPRTPPERYESGTLNVPGIAGLEAGLLFVRRQGPQALCQKELALLARLHRQLDRLPGVELYTGEPRAPYFLPVLSFNLRGLESEAVGERLGQAGIAVRCGLHCAPLAHQKLGTQQGHSAGVPLGLHPAGRRSTPWPGRWAASAGRKFEK